MRILKLFPLASGIVLLILMVLSTRSFSNLNVNNMENSEKLGLYVILKAKPHKVNDVKQFLLLGMDLANQERGTISWYAFQIDSTTFGIFDTFQHEDDRNTHLNGEIAKALIQNADELFEDFNVDNIKKLEILASK